MMVRIVRMVFFSNVEEPASLIARMKLPTNYDADTIGRCGLSKNKDASELLARKQKLSTVKGVPTIVDLSIQADSKELAGECATAIFNLIRQTQRAIAEPFIAQAKFKIIEYQKRLDSSRGLISRSDKSGGQLSNVYLATRDEVNYLTYEIARLQEFITLADAKMAELTAPVYVLSNSVYPNKLVTILLGLLAGFFLGLLFVMGRRAYRSMYSGAVS